MSRPKNSAAYPPAMLAALDKVHAEGSIIIPTNNPMAMRLHFQGLRGALRNENKAEIIDTVIFKIQKDPSALLIVLRENEAFVQDIAAALGTNTQLSAIEDAEASLNRILGKL